MSIYIYIVITLEDFPWRAYARDFSSEFAQSSTNKRLFSYIIFSNPCEGHNRPYVNIGKVSFRCTRDNVIFFYTR